jgi:hypothetical protein
MKVTQWVFVLSAFASAPLAAADFRVVDFGQSCGSVQKLEEAQGSKPMAWSKPSPDLHTFSGRAFDRDVAIAFLCPNDSFRSGNYYFPNESLLDAVESLHTVYDKLVANYGAAFLDTSPWQTGQKIQDPRAISSDPSKYYVTWRAGRISTTVTIMPGDRTDTWRVFVVIDRNR